MPRRGVFARRSAAEWGVRTLIATGLATAGYASVTRTLAYTVRGSDLDRAYAIAPQDARIAALLSQQLAGADATPADRGRAGRLARQALREDATTVAAVATLGINAVVRGDTASARHLFGYAERLSRRDLRTQIWAIEEAVSRNDVSGALRHYDVALRTGRNASTLLFPVLSSAITEPQVRAALTGTLARGPDWGPHFINYAAAEGPDPRAAARLFDALRRARVVISNGARAALIDRLIVGNFLDEAWSVHAATNPAADRRTSRDPNFRGDAATASRLDWMPVNDGGISTSIQRNEDDSDGVFAFSAPSSVGGMLLQQWQVLPPGPYRLEGHSAAIEQSENARPYWVLSCSDGRELGRVTVPNVAQATRFAGRFSVPSGCPVQRLSLFAPPSDAVGGQSGEIRNVRLRPVR